MSQTTNELPVNYDAAMQAAQSQGIGYNQFCAALRHYLASRHEQAQGGMAWRPIETAPKDGARILVDFGPLVGVHAVAWEEAVSGIEIWCVDDNKHGPYAVRGYVDEDIAGWMPLPTHPTADARQETQG